MATWHISFVEDDKNLPDISPVRSDIVPYYTKLRMLSRFFLSSGFDVKNMPISHNSISVSHKDATHLSLVLLKNPLNIQIKIERIS